MIVTMLTMADIVCSDTTLKQTRKGIDQQQWQTASGDSVNHTSLFTIIGIFFVLQNFRTKVQKHISRQKTDNDSSSLFVKGIDVI